MRILKIPFDVKYYLNIHRRKEKVAVANHIVPFIFGIKWTYVIHCKWDLYSVESNCEIATNERFLGANGLTLNKHRTRLFVNDPLAKTVTVYTITDHGGKNVLRKEENIELPMVVDNIEYDHGSDEIWMGTLPDLTSVMQHSGNKSIPVPGGFAVLRNVDGQWSVEDVLEHDGSKLSQVSAGARFGSRIILGSPYSDGILVCN